MPNMIYLKNHFKIKLDLQSSFIFLSHSKILQSYITLMVKCNTYHLKTLTKETNKRKQEMATKATKAKKEFITPAQAATAELSGGIVLENVVKLSKEYANMAGSMQAEEVRQLVRVYCQVQHMRVQVNNMNKAAAKNETGVVPLFDHFLGVFETVEKQISKAVLKWVEAHPVGKWIIQVHGIGPVISGGLLSNLDITKAKSHGAFWKFAGISGNPADNVWDKGQKRPWNAELKKLMFLMWNSFQYQQARANNFYGRMVFAPRQKQEWAKNYLGQNAETALARAEKVAKSTDAYLWYSGCYKAADVRAIREEKLSGDVLIKRMQAILGTPGSGTPMLPPAHIEARAGRFVSSVFLSHLFDVWYETHYGTPAPQPYVVKHMNHDNWINNPYVIGGPAAEGMTMETIGMFKTFDVIRPDLLDGYMTE
jgi:hypothetical protein